MDNFEKLAIIRELLLRSKTTIDSLNIYTTLKHIAGFNFESSITAPSAQTSTFTTREFDEIFPDIRNLFLQCDSVLNPTISGIALLTIEKLDLDPLFLAAGKYENIFFESCSDTGDWHSHKFAKEMTRSFTVHFPIWTKDTSKPLSEIEYSIDFIEDFSMVEKYSYEAAKVEAEQMFLEGKVTSLKAKGFTFLDFRSSYLHRGNVPPDVILCNLVFNYCAKNALPEVLNANIFKSDMTFEECFNILPEMGAFCNSSLCKV